MSFGFLENKEFNQTASNFYMFSMVLSLTFTVLISLTNFRRKVLFYYFYYFHAPNKDKQFNFLKIRTILLHSTNKISNEESQLKERIQEAMETHKIYGKLIELKKVPDYSAILDCEYETIDLEITKTINDYGTKVNCFSKMIMPARYYDTLKYNKRIRELEEKSNSIRIRRKNKDSGYAFACFDHFETISKLKKFERKFKTEDWWKCWQIRNEHKKVPYFQIFVNYNDINWMNCYSNKNIHFVRTFLLKVLVVLILIFMSTPTSVLRLFKESSMLEKLGYDKLKTYLDDNQFWSFILQTYLPPIIILLINKVILIRLSL
jgi:hypothetical protein